MTIHRVASGAERRVIATVYFSVYAATAAELCTKADARLTELLGDAPVEGWSYEMRITPIVQGNVSTVVAWQGEIDLRRTLM